MVKITSKSFFTEHVNSFGSHCVHTSPPLSFVFLSPCFLFLLPSRLTIRGNNQCLSSAPSRSEGQNSKLTITSASLLMPHCFILGLSYVTFTVFNVKCKKYRKQRFQCCYRKNNTKIIPKIIQVGYKVVNVFFK